jgi:gliding motility-associated-like protein
MKKYLHQVILITVFSIFHLLFSVIAVAQTYNMPAGTNTYNTCSGLFYDSGGSGGNYSNNENRTITFCPTTPGAKIQINFTAFNIENNYDFLYIYDGPNTGSPSLGVYTGTGSPGMVQATPGNASGCITIRFTSDGSVTAAGWAATISCVTPCQTITANWLGSTPAPQPDGVIRVCQGTPITFNGSGTFSNSGAGATYTWSFGNGNTATGTSVTYTYPAPGAYLVNLTITDPNGCTNNNFFNRVVQVSTTPTINLNAAPTTVCVGQSSNLSANVTMTPFTSNCTPPVSGTTFLPDGTGASYQTSIPVNCYAPGQTITSASDIQSICLDMEHSYLGDLEIRIICPNGQSSILKAYPGGGGTYLGCPLDDPLIGPGTGRTYCFTPSAGTLLVSGPTSNCGTPAGPSINAGNYMPVQPFTNLIGCPVNGNWTIQVTDNLAQDNGYIFSWDVNFAASLNPPALSFTPSISSQGWVPAAGLTNTGPTTATVTPGSPGAHCYTYSVTDNFGCTYNQNICINAVSGPTIAINATPGTTVCSGNSVTLTASGGTSYLWSGGITNGVPFIPPAAPGNYTYTVTATNASGCTATSSITISVINNNTVTGPGSATVCVGSAMTPITHNTTGATGIGAPTGLPTGVTANFAGGVITISGTPTTAGTYNYSIPLTGGCGTVNATGTITVINNNTVTGPGSATVCVGSAMTPITHNTTGATGIGAPTGLPAGVTANFAGGVITISGTPTTAGTYNYSIPLTGGCGTVNATGTITVINNNTVTGPGSATVCVGSAMTPITHNTTGATGIGAPTGLPAGVTANFAGGVITISGTPTTAGTYNYSIPLTGGCGTVNATGTITVINNNTVTGPGSATVCVGSAMTPITHNTTGATGIGAPTGLPTGVTANFAGGVITISGTPTTAGTYNYSIPLTGGCGTVNATGTITVINNNTVTGPGSATVCVGSAMTPITHNTTGATGIGAPTGLPAGVTANFAGGVITISGTPTTAGTYNYSIPLTGGCGTVNATGTITVINNNTVTGPGSATVCVGSAMTPITHNTTGATGIGAPTGLPTGVTANFAGGVITISGTPTTAGTYNYSIPLTGGCGTVNATGTITVINNNTVTGPGSATVCVGSAMTPITHNTTGATGIGAPTGLPTGVTANFAGGVITISGTPTTAGTYNYSIPLTGGCGTVNATGTITVINNNTVTGPGSATVCVGSAMTPITHNTTGATGIGAPTGLPAGVTANFAGGVITISGTPTTAGTYNYSIPLTGGCGTVNATGTITVINNNTVTGPGSATVCVGSAMTPITHNTTGATGIGAPTGLPTGVTANFAGGVITISGTPTTAGTYNYSIPLTGGCGTVNATGTITVINNNTVTGPGSATVCVGSAMTPITHNTTGATGIGAPTGLPTGVTANFAGGVITISGTPTTAGTYNYSIPLTGGCGTVNATGTITVINNNTVTGPGSATVCVGSAMTPITHNTTGATGIGAPTGLPTGVTANFAGGVITISGTPTTAGTYNYSIPLTGGCGTVNATGTITVINNNTVTGPGSATVCVGSAMTPITHNTTGATGIGAPTGLPTGVTANFAGGVITISGTPTTAGTYNYSIPLTGGCGTVNATGTITVNPLPNVGITALPGTTVCSGTSVTLSGTGAVSYAWSGGISDGVAFTPVSSGTYTVTGTDGNGCTATSSINITVNPLPTVGINAVPGTTVCAGSSVTLNGTGAVSYVWSGGISNGVAFVPPASGTYTVTGTDGNGCTATSSINITVNPLPTVGINAVPGTTVCAGSSVTLNGTGAVSYVWSGGISNGVAFVPPASGTYTVTGTDGNGCTATSSVNITVNPLPTVGINAVPGTTVCAGSSVTLNGTGAVSYVWSGGISNGVAFVPPASGTYTVTGTDGNGCTATSSVNITVNPLPTVGINAVPGTTVCAGSSVTLNGTGAVSYVWSGGISNGVAFVPPASGTYTVTGTDGNGCTATSSVNITVNPLPTVGINALPGTTVCSGTSVTLSGTGAVSYAWSGGISDGVAFTPASSGTYTVTGTDGNGCTATSSVNITVNPLPTVGINAVPGTTVCAGSSVTLNGTGAVSYAWSGGISNGVAFVPPSSGTYTVTGTDGNGCTATSSVNITVNPLPTVGINAVPGTTVCAGSSVTLNGTGAVSYAWSGGISDGVAFTPASSGTYTVTGTDGNGCTATSSVNITVNPLPTVGINALPGTTVCSGTSVTLSGTGAVSYAWSGGISDGVAFTPASSGTYTVTGTDGNGCTATSSVNITVNPLPTVGINALPGTTVCSGNSVTLSGTGALSYAWSGGISDGVAFTPGSSGTYTVTGTDGNGCTATSSVNITVNPLPTVGINALPGTTVCSGTSVTLSGTGAVSYAWSGGISDGVAFTPGFSGTYTVTGTDGNGCTATSSVNITVNPLPTVGINALPGTTVCSGTSVTLSGTGAVSYAWSGGISDGVAFTPVSSGTYTVTGTDGNGCTATSSINITVNPLPTVGINALPGTTVCSGTSVTLSGTGAVSYAWSGGISDGVAFTPASSGTYTVTGTDGNGCTATSSVNITVNPLPTVGINALPGTTVCSGNSVTLSGTGALSYAWSGGISDGVAFTPASSGTYTVTGTDGNGCTATSSINITVNPLPTVGITALPGTTVCSGNSVTLSGTGALSYAWSGGISDGVAFTPGSSGTYTVTGTDGNGCTATSSINITVNPLPMVQVNYNGPVCEGVTLSLNASGGSIYVWTGPNNFVSNLPNPQITNADYNLHNGIYTVTVTDGNGCTNSATLQVVVNDNPVVNFNASQLSGCEPLCVDFTDLSTVQGATLQTIDWYVNGNSIGNGTQINNYCFNTPGLYTVGVAVTSSAGCSSNLVLNNYIQVYSQPIADFNINPELVPISNPFVQFIDNSSGYISNWVWNLGDGSVLNEQHVFHSYTDTGQYCVTLTVASNGNCTSSITHCLYVYPEFYVYIPNAFTPNGDKLNEYFQVEGVGIKQIEMEIYNRWGEKIYETTSLNGWPGTIRTGTEEAEQGVYVYKIVVYDYLNKSYDFHGHVTLIR